MPMVLEHKRPDCDVYGKEINLYTNMTDATGKRRLVPMGLFCPHCNAITITRKNYDEVIIARNEAKRKKQNEIDSRIAI